MSLQLPDSLWSADDLKAVILEIQAYSRWFSAASIKQRVAAKGAAISEPPTLSPAAVTLLRDAGSQNALSPAGLEELINALQLLAAKSPQMTFTLAAPPSMSLKKSLVQWCRQNVHPAMLVNFRFNATLLGGMVVQYGSHIYDWSFRKQILANRTHFPEVLRHV